VALAFQYFRESGTDICVIETGLGGRLDSTNVVAPELSVITSIAFDHMQFLGDTLAKIAGEKAGIIKKGVPVVVGEAAIEVREVIEKRAVEAGSFAVFAQDFELPDYASDLHGPYQFRNRQCVLHAIRLLQERGIKIDEEAIQSGLQHVCRNTGLRGRWQWVQDKPAVLMDVAHNEAGIRVVMEEVARMDFRELHIVWGMMAEKDIGSILILLPKNARYYFCSPALPRALATGKLVEEAGKAGLVGNSYESVSKAYEAALGQAGENDMVLVTGSTFVVAEVLPDE
jgi:dihydrofolate synthase/folylpolyglutamate synthase